MQNIMTLQQFSDITSIGIIILFIVLIIKSIMYFSYKRYKNLVDKISYQNLVLIMLLIISAGIIGANIHELVYGDLPCMLCWYQRVTIYPMFIIGAVELFKKTRIAHYFISTFAALTFAISSYHYYYHFRRYVLGDILSLPCSDNPLIPSCTESKVISFGFMTMPLMSVVLSLTMLAITYLMYKKVNNK